MLNLNHNSGPTWYGSAATVQQPESMSDIVNGYIDAGLTRAHLAQPSRNYLGASRLGDQCSRKLVYEYRKVKGTVPSGLLLRVFAVGHAFEALTIEWLKKSGFVIRDRDRNGDQFAFQTAAGKIAGHIDGVFVDGPKLPDLPYPFLFEHKAIKSSSWNSLRKNGLAAFSDVYIGQVHLYLGYLDLKHCLFGALNKDTQELYWEKIDVSLSEAQRLSDRAIDIINAADADKLPSRIANSPDFYKCRMCDHAKHCWETGS
jgi:hypothetical protein